MASKVAVSANEEKGGDDVEKDLMATGGVVQTFKEASSFRAKPSNTVAWDHVNFKVARGNKTILKDCWGEVPSGKVAAIMGPSGAGKSSILNVLAGRSASAAGIEITGNISVGGTKINPVAFRERIAYVMQDDSLLATATPREALEFSAQVSALAPPRWPRAIRVNPPRPGPRGNASARRWGSNSSPTPASSS